MQRDDGCAFPSALAPALPCGDIHAALYEAAVFQIILDHTSSRAGTGSARRRRLVMQVLVLVRWTFKLIAITLVCSSGSSESPRMLLYLPSRNDPPIPGRPGTPSSLRIVGKQDRAPFESDGPASAQ